MTRWCDSNLTSRWPLSSGNILGEIVRSARRCPSAVVLQDVSRKRLSYRGLLAGTAALAARWRQLLPSGPGGPVGVLLPNSNAVPATLLSLWSADRVPAIFNFSTGVPTMLACAQLAGVKHIITSRLFLERAKLNLQPMADAGMEFIYLEDVRAGISRGARWRALAAALFRQESIVGAQQREDTAVILFTSGSEGPPKGVELTHGNLLANIRQLLAVLDVTDSDRFFNALPLFHSFGLLGLAPAAGAGHLYFSLSFAAALSRHSVASLRSGLHDLLRHQHLPQRLRAQGQSV